MKKVLKNMLITFLCMMFIMPSKVIKAAESNCVIQHKNEVVYGTEGEGALPNEQLEKPEKGWNRYDDSNELITYSGKYKQLSNPEYYDGTLSVLYGAGSKIKFTVNGTKMRILVGTVPAVESVTANKYEKFRAQLYVDSEKKKIYSHNSTKLNYALGNRVEFDYEFETDGNHNIELELTSDKDEVHIDAIDVMGAITKNDNQQKEDGNSNGNELVPLYKYHRESDDSYDYSLSYSEKIEGYNYDSIYGYINTTQVDGTVPLYKYLNKENNKYYFTVDKSVLGEESLVYELKETLGYIKESEAAKIIITEKPKKEKWIPLSEYKELKNNNYYYTSDTNESAQYKKKYSSMGNICNLLSEESNDTVPLYRYSESVGGSKENYQCIGAGDRYSYRKESKLQGYIYKVYKKGLVPLYGFTGEFKSGFECTTDFSRLNSLEKYDSKCILGYVKSDKCIDEKGNKLTPLFEYSRNNGEEKSYSTKYTDAIDGDYKYNGVKSYIYEKQVTGTVPLYKYYNYEEDKYYFTVDNSIYKSSDSNFKFEECIGYIEKVDAENIVTKSSHTEANWINLYRYCNLSTDKHFYTTNFNTLKKGNETNRAEGITCLVLNKELPGTKPLYKYHNNTTGDYLYTIDFNELGNGSKEYYEYEGIEGYIYEKQEKGLIPLYRYVRPSDNAHHYTASYAELGESGSGYKLEKIAGYVRGTNSIDDTGNKLIPLYRYYNIKNANNRYSSFYKEKIEENYEFKNVFTYMYEKQIDGTVPLYEYYCKENKKYYYTVNKDVFGNSDSTYEYKQILGYVNEKDVSNIIVTEKNEKVNWIKMYKYTRNSDSTHFYTTDFNEKGDGDNEYSYDGADFLVLDREYLGTKPLYRYHRTSNGDYYYTTDFSELGNAKWDYVFDKVECYLYEQPKEGVDPLYRYCRDSDNSHIYTESYNELGGGTIEYRYDWIEGYVKVINKNREKWTRLYKYKRKSDSVNFYTTDFSELGRGNSEYFYEGVDALVLFKEEEGTKPLYRYRRSSNGDYYYTTDFNELGNSKWDYVYQRIECYIYDHQVDGTVPLYRYCRDSDNSHIYTTDYNKFGSGTSEYRYDWIEGYVKAN